MKYMAPKGQRIKHQFFGVEVEGHMWIEEEKKWLDLFSDEYKKLVKIYGASSIATCRSFRAFQRMLRKHRHIKGKARLVSRFVKNDILA